MRPTDQLQTTDLDQAAAIMAGTGTRPNIHRQSGDSLVSFAFEASEEHQHIALAYSTGALHQPVKRFAACRAWLYRQARKAMQGGVWVG